MSGDQKLDLRKATAGIGGRLMFWEYLDRLRRSMRWNIPSMAHIQGSVARRASLICGGGPSLEDSFEEIQEMRHMGALLVTVNKTYDWFVDRGEVPDFHIMLDPMEWVADYVKKPQPNTKFLIAHQCHAKVFRKLHSSQVFLWVSGADYYGVTFPPQILQTEFKDKSWTMVAGTTTVGMRAVPVMYQVGSRHFHLFGMDSSLRPDKSGVMRLHAYAKDKPPDAEEGWITLNTKHGEWRFYTNNHMAKQTTDFQDMCDQFAERIKNKTMEPIAIRVYGDGLLPAYAASVNLHGHDEINAYYQGKVAA